MTVLTHPDDQGPVDPVKRGVCDHCDERIKRRGNEVYRWDTPKHRRDHSHHGVCPYCLNDPGTSLDTETVTCLRCDLTFPLIEAPNVGSCAGTTLCLGCKEPLTEEHCERHFERGD